MVKLDELVFRVLVLQVGQSTLVEGNQFSFFKVIIMLIIELISQWERIGIIALFLGGGDSYIA